MAAARSADEWPLGPMTSLWATRTIIAGSAPWPQDGAMLKEPAASHSGTNLVRPTLRPSPSCLIRQPAHRQQPLLRDPRVSINGAQHLAQSPVPSEMCWLEIRSADAPAEGILVCDAVVLTLFSLARRHQRHCRFPRRVRVLAPIETTKIRP